MKRKLFSAILFGACLVASTSGLTSCKDYDDDISNLQSQIDKLATKEELQSKAKDLEDKINAAQNAANAASEVAKAAKDAAAAASSDAKAANDAAAAAKAAAEKAQNAADNAQGAADAVADDLKKAVENAASQIQEAVKNLATKDEVAAAVKEVADKYDAQAKDLKALSDRLAKVEAKLGLGEGGEDIDLTEIQKELEDIEDAFEALVGVVSDMVTSVELVYNSQDYKYNGAAPAACPNDLSFKIVTEKKNDSFGKDKADKILTTTRDQTSFYNDEIYVRVNPVDAVLTKEDISLINSKGQELTGIVDVIDVQPYKTGDNDGYLTRAANLRTGLWAIKVAPAAGKKVTDLWSKFTTEAYDWVTTDKTPAKNQIVYAVAVKSAISDSIASNRRIVSAYDVTMQVAPYKATVSDISDHNTTGAEMNTIRVKTSATVDIRDARLGKNINEIHNRFKDPTFTSSTPKYGKVAELVWKDAKTPEVSYKYNRDNDADATNTAKAGDERLSKSNAVARVGEDINISFSKDIKGFYVMLDYDYVETASQPSEKNAWNSYQYENVGKTGVAATMFDGNYGTIKVSQLSGEAKGDEIGFRIFAMNLDGTLVDPDGIAFYVTVGEASSADINLTAQNILVTKAVGAQGFVTGLVSGESFNDAVGNITAQVKLPTDAFKGFTDGTITCTNIASPWLTAAVGTDYQILYLKGSDWKNTFDADAKAIKIQILKPTSFVDEATYRVTIPLQKTATTGTGTSSKYTVKNAVIDITKKMPTSCPTFIWKTNQTELQALVPADGKYANDGSKKDGILNFKNMFIVADGSEIDADNSYVFKLASSEIYDPSNKKKTVDLYRAWGSQYYYYEGTKYTNGTATTNSYEALIPNKFIDGTTTHALTTEYNYGNISNETWNNAKTPYKLSSSNYSLKYTTWSVQSADYMSYAWKKVDIDDTDATNYQPRNFLNTKETNPSIKVANILASGGQMINGNLLQANLADYVKDANKYLKITKVETKSNTNFSITNEYYEVKTIDNSNGVITFQLKNNANTVPNHSAQVWITVKDCFQHEEVIKLDVEFKAIIGTNKQLASNNP